MTTTASARQHRTILSITKRLCEVLLTLAIIVSPGMYTNPVAADSNGYPWDPGAQPTGAADMFGYLTCPSNDTGCMHQTSNGYGISDPWLYWFRQCTSYVAWKINQAFNINVPTNLGDASTWWSMAQNDGFGTVHVGSSYTPQVGDIADWVSKDHVAYVYAVSNGIASLDEYNVGLDGNFYTTRTTASNSAGIPDYYIHIADLSPFLIRTGTDIQGKDWLGNTWSTINGTPATDLRVSGNLNTSRISYTDTNGYVWAKDSLPGSLYGDWVNEYTNPSQYATSPSLFVIRTGTTVSGKEILTDPWTTLNGTAASDMRVSGDGSITYTATNGDVWAKEGFYGAWYDEYPSPNQYASSDTLFVIRLGTNVYGKQNLGDAWTLLNGTSATDIRVNGSRITYTDTNGHVWAKDGLYGTWYDMYTNPSQYAASDNIFVVRNGTSVIAKAHLTDSTWTTLNGTSATDIRVNGNRVTYTDTNGDVWAKDYLGGAWTDEYNYPSQYAASNT